MGKAVELAQEDMLKINIEPSGNSEVDKIVFEILDKYNLAEIVSEETGLSWTTDEINIKHQDSTADWEGIDTVLVNYEHGIWVVSGVAHEMVHLILRQNKWDESSMISDFIKKHPEIILSGSKRGDGYRIEQIIAYLTQKDIHEEIGRKEGDERMEKSWGKEKFEKIIEMEYNSEFRERLARTIMRDWETREKGTNLIEWIEKVLLNWDK